MIPEIGLNLSVFGLGFENWMNCWKCWWMSCWFHVLCCLWRYDGYKTCKRFCKSIWVIGGSKLGFWMKMGLENRSFENCPDEHWLKRANRRSSERHSFLPRIEIYPFAQACRKRTPSVQNLMLRHFGRLSELPVA